MVRRAASETASASKLRGMGPFQELLPAVSIVAWTYDYSSICRVIILVSTPAGKTKRGNTFVNSLCRVGPKEAGYRLHANKRFGRFVL